MDGFAAALMCLSLNIYHESRGELEVGQYAVAYVTINRARENNDDICDVVFKYKQFSWANNALDKHGKLLPEYMPHGKAWQKSQQIARNALANTQADFTSGSKYYYADSIAAPKWAYNLKYTGKYGHHYFYRER